MPYGISPVNFTPYYIYIRVENVHSTDMQEVTPIVVPMAVRIAISSWMPYFKSSRLFFIVVKV